LMFNKPEIIFNRTMTYRYYGFGWQEKWVSELSKAASVEFEFRTLDDEVFSNQQALQELKQDFKKLFEEDEKFVLGHPDFGRFLVKELPQVPYRMIGMGWVDSLIIKHRKVAVVENAHYYSCISQLETIGYIDPKRPALVVGEGAEVYSAVAALFYRGLRNIHLCSSDKFVCQKISDHLSKYYLGLNVDWIDPERLTSIAGIFSLAINTGDLFSDEYLLNGLSFFNYLTKGGWVMNWTLRPGSEDMFTERAKEVGASVITPDQFLQEMANQVQKIQASV